MFMFYPLALFCNFENEFRQSAINDLPDAETYP